MGLERIPPGPERRRHLPLLLLADEVAERYLAEGELWLHDGGIGAVLTIPIDDTTIELRNVAVAEEHQGAGLGTAMLAELVDRLATDGWQRAVVGTGTADPRTYIFYQRCGFRPWRVERDVFTPERGYDPAAMVEANGLVHRDMLWFDRDLYDPAT